MWEAAVPGDGTNLALGSIRLYVRTAISTNLRMKSIGHRR